MRILVSNERLDERAGSDLFVRDLARGLSRLGHFVFAYSSDLRQRERLLERDSVSVATDLENLPFRPDVIHARHHLDAMAAVMALPDVPAIYHCSQPGRISTPPTHPRIYRYLAPSDTEAQRVAKVTGVSRASVDVVHNAVDTARFYRVRQPADRPRRALVYNVRQGPESDILSQIRAAVKPLNLELEVIGRYLGREVDDPENRLPNYDVVFAAGRSALEALACGCAVVVLDETGCGEMVCETNFERLRLANFAVPPGATYSAESIRIEVEQYSTSSWAVLTESARCESDYMQYLKNIEKNYQAAIELHNRSLTDFGAENRAVSEYLYKLAPKIKEMAQVQRAGGEITMSAAAMWLDVSARIAAMQREFDKPGWF
jgi:hypothetical protein